MDEERDRNVCCCFTFITYLFTSTPVRVSPSVCLSVCLSECLSVCVYLCKSTALRENHSHSQKRKAVVLGV